MSPANLRQLRRHKQIELSPLNQLFESTTGVTLLSKAKWVRTEPHPTCAERLPAPIRRSTILAKHRLEAYATLTSSRGGCWFVDLSTGDLEASLHTPED
jgi:hypothetical protein